VSVYTFAAFCDGISFALTVAVRNEFDVMCRESIELVFDYWQCIVGRAVINNDKIVSMIFLTEFSNSVKGWVYAICFVVNRQNYRYLPHGCWIWL